MKVQVIGLGQFGMFLARLFAEAGHQLFGYDTNLVKRLELESFGGIWEERCSDADVRMLAIFPSQYQSIPNDGSLVVNLSSVQQSGIDRLLRLGVNLERILSFHPLFGPVGVSRSGWIGKQIILTMCPMNDRRAQKVLQIFFRKEVSVEKMTPEEHDAKMASHALAFLLAELVSAGAVGVDPRYLTGSARQMLGLTELTVGSDELRKLILSNPALKAILPIIRSRLAELSEEFGW